MRRDLRKFFSCSLVLGLGSFVVGCGIEPDRVFERNAPQVDRAIEALDAGEAGVAAELLQQYLGTGRCEAGELGVSDFARERKNASFDLGLTLFLFAEQFGPRFGQEDEGLHDGGPTDEQKKAMELRSEQVTCALRLLRAIGASKEIPVDLAARAKYLEGNLEFLRRNYKDAVNAYDEALRLIPGVDPDAGDGIGRDAAWNRAIALRRIQDENERDAGQDAPEDQDASSDATPDTDAGSPEGGEDAPQEAGDEGQDDAPSEDSGGGDGSPDAGDGSAPEDENKTPDAGAPDGGQQPPPEPVSQDERMLDMLEAAPTVQLEDARRNAARRQVRGMVDK